MFRLLSLVCAVLIPSSDPLSVQEPSLTQVLQQHRQAVGGVEALISYTTARLRYQVAGEAEQDLQLEMLHGEESACRETISGAGRWQSRSFDGETVWAYSPLSRGVTTFHHADGTPADQLHYQTMRAAAALFPLLAAERLGAEVRLLPRGGPGWRIQARYPDGMTRLFELSAQYLLQRDTCTYSTDGLELQIVREYDRYELRGEAQLPNRIVLLESAHLTAGVNGTSYRRSLTLNLVAAESNVEFGSDQFITGTPGTIAAGTTLAIGNHPVQFLGELPTGDEPSTVIAADFTGDGITDLLSGEKEGISLFPGTREGGYPARFLVTTGGAVSSLAGYDFDGDGKRDILAIVRDRSDLVLQVHRSLGEGRFAAPAILRRGLNANPLVVANAGVDGDVIVMVLGAPNAGICIARPDGAGSLAIGTVLPLEDTPDSILVADLDGDGSPDVCATDRKSLLVFKGGEAGFAGAHRLSAGAFPWCVAAADLTGDGVADILIGNGGPLLDVGQKDFCLLVGLGGGMYREASFAPGGTGITSLATVDLDGDGRAEIVATSPATHELLFYAATESGVELLGSLAVTWTPDSVICGDFDGDGAVELVTANSASDSLSRWRIQPPATDRE